MDTVAVLMTCHNRRDLTLAAIAAVLAAGRHAGLKLRIYLTDDGSTDGTAAAVGDRFPDVRILPGDGNLFWNQGMRLAWRHALADAPPFYLWLNDDLAVFPDALANMIACYRAQGGKTIVVGRTIDPGTGAVTYGAYARADGWSRLRFRHLRDGESAGVTMNGNLVLIPGAATADIGINHAAFRHAAGDVDYGLRATRAGYAIRECPQPVGLQERNMAYARRTESMTFATLRRTLSDPKGVPAGEWLTFCRAHGGPLWPVNFAYRYLKMLARGYRPGTDGDK